METPDAKESVLTHLSSRSAISSTLLEPPLPHHLQAQANGVVFQAIASRWIVEHSKAKSLAKLDALLLLSQSGLGEVPANLSKTGNAETAALNAIGHGQSTDLPVTKTLIADARLKALLLPHLSGSMALLALPSMMGFVEMTAQNATGLGQVAQTGKTKTPTVDANHQALLRRLPFCNEISKT